MSFATELRHAGRSLVRRPAFGIVVVLTIAVGVAANSSIFSVVNAVLLQPIPVRDPDRLIRPDVRMAGGGGFLISTSVPNFKDWRQRNRTLASIGLNANRQYTLTGGDRPAIVNARLILGDFFETLGVPPARGRWITADQTDQGAAALAVVTARFVTDHLDPAADPIGQTITLDGEPFTIVGVMPPRFTFPSPETGVYLPMGYFSRQLCWEARGCSQGSWSIGRLKPGVTLADGSADFDRIWREINELEGREQARPELHPLIDRTVGETRTPVLVLMGAVGFVLLIACANVASLILARGESRRRDLAVRAALGASRGQLLAAMLAETTLLSLAGAIVGLALTVVGLRFLRPLVAGQLPAFAADRIGIDPAVLAFTVGASLLAGLLFGLAPALRGAAVANDDLRHGNRAIGGSARQRFRSALVVSEVALSLVLLTGAGLMIRSIGNLQRVDKGFDGRNVLTAEVPLPAIRYGEKEKSLPFFDRLTERARALPGVTKVAFSNSVPLSGNSWENGIIPEGLDPADPKNFQSVQFQFVTPEYFDALGLRLVKGRFFSDADREGSPRVAIIDETMAERFWPGQDPLGKRVSYETEGSTGHNQPAARLWREVVGVTRNVRHYELESPSRIQIYVPAHQSGLSWSRTLRLVVATTGDPRRVAEPLRQLVSELDPDVPLAEVSTMEALVEGALGQTRVVGELLTVFSAVAAALAGLGLFGLLAYTVAQRVREIGVRMALGASTGQVVRLVAGQGLRLAGLGIVVGVGAAFGLTRLLRGVLFEVEPADPVTFGLTAVGLLVVAVAAAVIPARRAARTDPVVVLRE